jgi:RimJ/RimL family protein N-acetyltransferase
VIKLVKLEPWHVEVLYSEGIIPPEIYSEGYAEYVCQSGHAVAAIWGERIVGIGGVMHLWGSVADGWSFITPWLRQHPIKLVKVFKAFFLDCPQYRRVQITVEEDFEKAQSFAEFLGFTPEGRMEYYSPTGETHIRYARIR